MIQAVETALQNTGHLTLQMELSMFLDDMQVCVLMHSGKTGAQTPRHSVGHDQRVSHRRKRSETFLLIQSLGERWLIDDSCEGHGK